MEMQGIDGNSQLMSYKIIDEIMSLSLQNYR